MEKWKPYMDIRVTYCFGSKREVLDGSTIVQWLDTDHKGDVAIDWSKVEEYVRELSVKYNTAYCTKKLETSYGQVVSITKGHYGWMIDKKSEIEALIGIIQSGASQEREPVYLQTAASHDGPDFGNTYVEMNLTSHTGCRLMEISECMTDTGAPVSEERFTKPMVLMAALISLYLWPKRYMKISMPEYLCSVITRKEQPCHE